MSMIDDRIPILVRNLSHNLHRVILDILCQPHFIEELISISNDFNPFSYFAQIFRVPAVEL
jgi:hypothetical protein